jgi:hypothetical protein
VPDEGNGAGFACASGSAGPADDDTVRGAGHGAEFAWASGHGGRIRTELEIALRAAMKARDTVAISGLRSALAAIANAEAIPIPAPAPASAPASALGPSSAPASAGEAAPPSGTASVGGSATAGGAAPANETSIAASGPRYIAGGTAGLGASEASRRTLTGEELARIVQAEIADRQQAAQQYQTAGHPDRATRLLNEAQAIQSALAPTQAEDRAQLPPVSAI